MVVLFVYFLLFALISREIKINKKWIERIISKLKMKKDVFQNIKMCSVWQYFFFFFFLNKSLLQLTCFCEVFWFQQNCIFQESFHTPKICRFLPSVSHLVKIYISNVIHFLSSAHKTAFVIPQPIPIFPSSTASLFISYHMSVQRSRVCQRQFWCHTTPWPNKHIIYLQFCKLLHKQISKVQVTSTSLK